MTKSNRTSGYVYTELPKKSFSFLLTWESLIWKYKGNVCQLVTNLVPTSRYNSEVAVSGAGLLSLRGGSYGASLPDQPGWPVLPRSHFSSEVEGETFL